VLKKIWANFQRIIELFTQKFVTKLSKIWIWDPGSGIRKKPIPDPGARGQKVTGSRIPDPDPQHWLVTSAEGPAKPTFKVLHPRVEPKKATAVPTDFAYSLTKH
jgi:hypothetical protein